jgi:SAM-dependent methyltransferase
MMPFVDKVSPIALRNRLEELCRDDPATRVLSWVTGPQRFLTWAHCIGVVMNAELRACVSPVPPRELRQITASAEETEFLWTGLVDLSNFFDLYVRFGNAQNDRKLRVLDFACGCGRLSRYLAMHPQVEAYAVDVNPTLIAWCQTELSTIHSLLGSVLPPMPLDSATFDLVLALSLFSHLSERNALNWLADIGRVMLPGGILIVTTHGTAALEIIRGSAVHQGMFRINAAEVDALTKRLQRDGFIFQALDKQTLQLAQAGDEYGNSFIHPDYINQAWNTDLMEVIEHIEGGLRGWQDCVVLRRR